MLNWDGMGKDADGLDVRQRKNMVENSLSIVRSGGKYDSEDAGPVRFHRELTNAMELTRVYGPGESLGNWKSVKKCGFTDIQVYNEPAIVGAWKLHFDDEDDRVVALNSGSALRPGGTSRSGVFSQESGFISSTALVACQLKRRTYYALQRKSGPPFYSDALMHSPNVPVFRWAEDGVLREWPWMLGIITAAAPDMNAIKMAGQRNQCVAYQTMSHRIERILELARAQGYKSIGLNAFGCYTCGYDPNVVAEIFYDHLTSNKFHNAFRRVRFSILDSQGDNFDAFYKTFIG